MNVCFYVSSVLYIQTKLYDNILGMGNDGEEVDDGIYDATVTKMFIECHGNESDTKSEIEEFRVPFSDLYDMFRYR